MQHSTIDTITMNCLSLTSSILFKGSRTCRITATFEAFSNKPIGNQNHDCRIVPISNISKCLAIAGRKIVATYMNSSRVE